MRAKKAKSLRKIARSLTHGKPERAHQKTRRGVVLIDSCRMLYQNLKRKRV